jgi:hypothetical protein
MGIGLPSFRDTRGCALPQPGAQPYTQTRRLWCRMVALIGHSPFAPLPNQPPPLRKYRSTLMVNELNFALPFTSQSYKSKLFLRFNLLQLSASSWLWWASANHSRSEILYCVVALRLLCQFLKLQHFPSNACLLSQWIFRTLKSLSMTSTKSHTLRDGTSWNQCSNDSILVRRWNSQILFLC